MLNVCRQVFGIEASSTTMGLALCNVLGSSAATTAVSCTHGWCRQRRSMGVDISIGARRAARSSAVAFANPERLSTLRIASGGA
jgi:hypothetical protein